MMSKSISIALVSLVFLIAAPLAAAQSIVLGLAQNEAVQDVAAELLTEIYKRAGLSPTIQPMPPARVTYLVLKNEIDGEVARIAPYFEKNPSLIKVEPPYYYLVTTAFAKSGKGITINSTEDLKKYRVGIIRGVYHAAIATEGVPDLQTTDSVVQLFKMLDADRIEIAVDVRLNGLDTINQLGLKSIKPIAELARRDFYNVLTLPKVELAPRISAVIKSMTASGELNKMIKSAEKKRLSKEHGLQ